MAKKQGLGAQVNKSITVMEELVECLGKFANIPIKRGLSSIDKDEREDIKKMINESSEIAFSLKNKVDDLKEKVEELKPPKNSRFARNVVARFLEDDS
jgi:hypothetical protein